MKKMIIALLLAAVFIFSIGAAYAAKEDNRYEIGTSVNSSVETQNKENESNDIESDLEDSHEDINESNQSGLGGTDNLARENNTARMERLRQLRDNQAQAISDAREKLQVARQKFEETKTRWQESKDKFETQKTELTKKCKNDNSAECGLAKEAIKNDSKDYLSKIADKILDHLDKLLARIESSTEITDEKKAEMIASVNAKIVSIEAAKEKAQNATTKQEIQDAAKQMKKEWTGMAKEIELNAEKVVNARLGNIADRADRLSASLDKKIADMKAKGLDTSKVEPLVADFKTLAASAKSHYQKAEDLFAQAKASTDPSNDLIKQAKEEMKAAQQDLKDAYAKIKDILAAIRATGETDMAVFDEGTKDATSTTLAATTTTEAAAVTTTTEAVAVTTTTEAAATTTTTQEDVVIG